MRSEVWNERNWANLVVKTTVVAWHGGKSREVRKKVKGEFGGWRCFGEKERGV